MNNHSLDYSNLCICSFLIEPSVYFAFPKVNFFIKLTRGKAFNDRSTWIYRRYLDRNEPVIYSSHDSPLAIPPSHRPPSWVIKIKKYNSQDAVLTCASSVPVCKFWHRQGDESASTVYGLVGGLKIPSHPTSFHSAVTPFDSLISSQDLLDSPSQVLPPDPRNIQLYNEQQNQAATMAFRQSTYHVPQRIYTTPREPQSQAHTPTAPSQSIEESQEWILFSPTAPSVTDHTYTTSTDCTRTAGHSRVSDFGSLDTAARSYGYDESSGLTEAVAEEEDDGELDSLDSHLHEFRTEPSVYRGEREGEASGTVLPTHDGLGSFRVDGEGGNPLDVQRHLYAFERFNPRRVGSKRRRESGDLALFEEESERAAEMERTRRD